MPAWNGPRKPRRRFEGEGVPAPALTQDGRARGWADRHLLLAAAFAGLFMQRGSLVTPLIIGAGLKVSYDVLLYLAFRRVKPPEEA